jgi:hypothetical protein
LPWSLALIIATVPPTIMLTADRLTRSVGDLRLDHVFARDRRRHLCRLLRHGGRYSIAIYLSGVLGLLAAMMAFGTRAASAWPAG